MTSHSSATTTIAVALRASSMAATLPAARGLREEDDAVGVARDLVERAHELGFAAAPGPVERHRGPEPLVELLTEGLDQRALLLGDLHVAFGEQHLAMAGLHAQQLHRSIMTKGPGPEGRAVARGRATTGAVQTRSACSHRTF